MTILACLVLAVLLYRMMHFGQRVLVAWMSDRVVKRILARPADAPRAQLDPESQYVVHITESEVSCHRPDGIVETVRWDELERINILTNGDGPFAPDCFWLLIAPGTTGCCIPQGATGDVELLARMQELPGFNNQVFMEAMGSHQEAIFTCWQRSS